MGTGNVAVGAVGDAGAGDGGVSAQPPAAPESGPPSNPSASTASQGPTGTRDPIAGTELRSGASEVRGQSGAPDTIGGTNLQPNAPENQADQPSAAEPPAASESGPPDALTSSAGTPGQIATPSPVAGTNLTSAAQVQAGPTSAAQPTAAPESGPPDTPTSSAAAKAPTAQPTAAQPAAAPESGPPDTPTSSDAPQGASATQPAAAIESGPPGTVRPSAANAAGADERQADERQIEQPTATPSSATTGPLNEGQAQSVDAPTGLNGGVVITNAAADSPVDTNGNFVEDHTGGINRAAPATPQGQVSQSDPLDPAQLERTQKDLSSLTDQDLKALGLTREDRAALDSVLSTLIKIRDQSPAGDLLDPNLGRSGDTIGPASPNSLPVEAWQPWWDHVDEALQSDPVPWERLAVAVALSSGATDPRELNARANAALGLMGFAGALGSTVTSKMSVDETTGETSSSDMNELIKAGATRAMQDQKVPIQKVFPILNQIVNDVQQARKVNRVK